MVMKLSKISIYQPKSNMTVPEVASHIRAQDIAFTVNDEQHLQEQLGFSSTPIEREYSLEKMIELACYPVIEQLIEEGKRIDRIMLVRTSIVHWHDHNLFRELIHKYNLSNTTILSVAQQNCASIHMGLRLIQSLLSQQSAMRGVLLVAADKAFHPSLRRIPASILGDMAACCYLSRPSEEPNGHSILLTHNSVEGTTYDGVNSNQADMDWFNRTYYFAIRQVINQLLRKAGLKLKDIRLIIGSNANLMTWRKLAELLDYSMDQFYVATLPKVGHLYCADILYNIQSAVDEGLLHRDDYYLTVTVGLGGTYGCTLHRY